MDVGVLAHVCACPHGPAARRQAFGRARRVSAGNTCYSELERASLLCEGASPTAATIAERWARMTLRQPEALWARESPTAFRRGLLRRASEREARGPPTRAAYTLR